MKSRLVCVIAAMLISNALEAQASLLLGSFTTDHDGGSRYTSQSPPAVTTYLQWDLAQLWGPSLGKQGPHWHDGETGYYDFTPENEPDFGFFANRLTDGLDEMLHVGVIVVNDNKGLWGHSEHYYGLGDPDLYGCEIDSIRLVVNSNDLTLNDGAVFYNPNVTWEFWGIPEPATLLLLGLGGLMVRRRKE